MQRGRESRFLKVGGDGRLLDIDSGVLAMDDDEETVGLARGFGRIQSSSATVEAVGMDLQMDGLMGSTAAGIEEGHMDSREHLQALENTELAFGSPSLAEFCMDSSCSKPLMSVDPGASGMNAYDVGGFSLGTNIKSMSDGANRDGARTGPQGVCGNDQRKSFSGKENGVGHDVSLRGQGGAGGAWKRPRMVAMPPLAELGEFSIDGTTAVLDPAEVETTSLRFAAALVGRLFGRRIPFNVLSGELRRRWAAHGNIRIVTMTGDCFICFFDCIEARDDVLRGGPWVILGQVLGIDCWTPAFSPGAATAFSTPVWVRIPWLPFYCWSSRNIGRIAAMVGEPLWIDGATADLERGSFARTCIRIDLAKPLKSGVWVEGPHGKFFQAFEYEGLSVFCCRCSRVGHKETTCNLPPPNGGIQENFSVSCGGYRRTVAAGVKDKVAASCLGKASKLLVDSGKGKDLPATTIELVGDMDGADGSEEKGVGPWMMVERRRRSNKLGFTGGRLSRHLEQVKAGHNKSILGPFNYARSTGAGQLNSGSYGMKMDVPKRVLPLIDNQQKVLGSKTLLDTVVSKVDVESSVHSLDPLSGDTDGHIFSGFSAQPRGDAEWLSSSKERSRGDKIRGAKKEKMKSDLGPITRGSRKRRKSYSSTDGGDRSPTRPP